jgi:hypothetical protein
MVGGKEAGKMVLPEYRLWLKLKGFLSGRAAIGSA